MKDKTMIRIKKDLREILRQRKKYDRETYNDVIKRELKKLKK